MPHVSYPNKSHFPPNQPIIRAFYNQTVYGSRKIESRSPTDRSTDSAAIGRFAVRDAGYGVCLNEALTPSIAVLAPAQRPAAIVVGGDGVPYPVDD